MTTEDKTALFDPGFSKWITDFEGNIEYFYLGLNSIKNFNQKKFKFASSYNRILELINTYIGFYVGCMLWGACLKSLGDIKIEGNFGLGEKFDEKSGLRSLNYILDFLNKFEKDVKYYMGKTIKTDEYKIETIKTYMEFLRKNKGFVETDSTGKIVLVGKLDKLTNTEIEEIKEKILDVVTTGRIKELLSFCDKI